MTMSWTYYEVHDGYLYNEDGDREVFDGARRSGVEWEIFFEAEDIRGTIR